MLTHIDQNQRPLMVDIINKEITERKAIARSKVLLSEDFLSYVNDNEIVLKKGPVFNTAIIAGVQAVKKTYEFIPFCHHIPIESCEIQIVNSSKLEIEIYCSVKTTYKTGVEMEALMGATVAALTIYDMCKAISSNILIKESELLYKSGGKKIINKLPIYGLVLTGGKSSRMKSDKALLEYFNKPQAEVMYNELSLSCDKVFISQKRDQWQNTNLSRLNTIEDQYHLEGPMAGIISAMDKFPFANWVVVACDLPFIKKEHIENLISSFDSTKIATSYLNQKKKFAEPLCSIYTPQARRLFKDSYSSGIKCPVKVLLGQDVKGLEIDTFDFLQNVNTPAEYQEVKNEIN